METVDCKTVKISKETAKKMIDSGIDALKRVATETYPELLLEALPEKWEDIPELAGYYIDSYSKVIHAEGVSTKRENTNMLPDNKDLAEAWLAMNKLLYLREIYRGGWTTKDCNIGDTYFYVSLKYKLVHWTIDRHGHHIFTFPTRQIADLFADRFSEELGVASKLVE